ncbi:NUDIX domain-containing protein [Rhizobiales bacterium]|uniref:NUDIX hydrolase n=1 Tax=Hongsoonwoonella zoysiae TaxID=2821844 RepID=UPI0015615C4A|nr:NUDIX domain-containing protein [Hongsoonwoonella zoysiae]NRG19722.1 NUDIX domain-containing protein [Hongsoonwoonella zoysiae]
MSEFPRLGVSVLCLRNREVLLVKRGKEPYLGHWSLPGGLVEFGEALVDAARRELFEETSVTARLEPEPFEIFDIIQKREDGAAAAHFVLAVFCGTYEKGEARAGDDAADAAWVRTCDLETLMMTPGTAARILRHVTSKTDGRG